MVPPVVHTSRSRRLTTTPTSPTLSGLARILSSEPLPQIPFFRGMDPQRVPPEIEGYARNLHIFLKNIFGKFTATNIITTINNGGDSGLVVLQYPIHYTGTDTITVTLNSTRDWRDYAFLNLSKMSSTRDGLRSSTPLDKDVGEYSGETSDLIVLSDGSIDVRAHVDGTTGVLSVDISPSGHQEYFILINLLAYGKIPTTGEFLSKGNGL